MLDKYTLGTLVIKVTTDSVAYEKDLARILGISNTFQTGMIGIFAGASATIAGSMAAMVATSINEYAKLDQAMTRSMAIMGREDAKFRKQLEGTARSVARNSVTSATKAAEAYYYMAASGMDALQVQAALPVVEKFAVAANLDLSRSTDLIVDSMNNMGLMSKNSEVMLRNMTRTTNVLTEASNRSNASQESLAMALRTKSGAAFRLLGKDIESATAILMVYHDQGIKSEVAGEALYQVTRDIQDAYRDNEAVWKSLGVEVFTKTGKMRELVDIISDLERLVGPLSDKYKKTAFSLMGFQDRSFAATQALLGFSDKIRQNEANLRSMGNATDRVAQDQLTSIINQFKIMINLGTDLALTFGEKMAPGVRMFLAEANNFLRDTSKMNSYINQFIDLLENGVVTAVVVVLDIFNGFKVTLLGINMLMVAVARLFIYAWRGLIFPVILKTFAEIENIGNGWKMSFELIIWGLQKAFFAFAQGVVWSWEKMVNGLNAASAVVGGPQIKTDSIELAKKLIDDATKSLGTFEEATIRAEKGQWHTQRDAYNKEKPNFLNATNINKTEWMSTLAAMDADFYKQINDAVDNPPSQKFLNWIKQIKTEWNENAIAQKKSEYQQEMWNNMVTLGKTVWNQFNLQMQRAKQSQKEVNAEASKYAVQIAQVKKDIEYAWEPQIAKLNELDMLFKKHLITMDQYQRAVAKLGIRDEIVDPLELALRKLREFDYMMQKSKNSISQAEYGRKADSIFQQNSPFFAPKGTYHGLSTGTDGVDSALQLNQQIMQMNQQYEIQKQVVNDYYSALESAAEGNADRIAEIEREKFERLAQMNENYHAQMENYESQRTSMALNSAELLFGSLADIGRTFGGEQSKLYKTMFAVSKAFAIADAMVKIQQGIANAASLPWPANIGAMASVAAASASIVSNIAAVKMTSFEGGGFTGRGDRVGGIDGKGGKIAMVHPNEKITDLTKANDTGISVEIHNYGNEKVKVEPTDDPRKLKVIVGEVMKTLASDVDNRRGLVPAAFERSYKLNRTSS